MASHSPLLIALMVVNITVFVLNLLTGFLSMVDTKELLGFELFNDTFAENDDYIEITPTPDTFSIWGLIFTWQAVWMIHGLVCICRRAPDGPVYTSPTLLTPAFYCVSIFNWACVITWYVLAAFRYKWASFVVLAAIFITIYICIGLSYKAVAEHSNVLVEQQRTREIWMIRAFVQNGLALYGTWCTIATLLNLAGALSYDVYPKFEQSTSSTIALSILSVELVLFVVIDWVVLEKHTRYTFTPYIVIIVALTGSIQRNWNPVKTNSIFTVVLLAAGGVAFIVKIVLMVVRHFRNNKEREVLLSTKQDTIP